MAFKLFKIDTLPARVTVNVPTGKAGVDRQETFTAQFAPMEQADYEQMLSDVRTDERTLLSVIDAQLVCVDDVLDEDGKSVPFEVVKPALLKSSRVVTALFRALTEAQNGTKQKNSNK